MTFFPDQQKAIAKLRRYKVGALFMEAGTGKTRVACELINSVPGVDLLVWVGPFRTINPPENSIKSVCYEVNTWGLFGFPVEYVGIETLQSSDRKFLEIEALIENAEKPFLVVDESIKIKNYDAKRTQRLLYLASKVEYKLILNGTPITRDLLDLWSQMQFLSEKILNMSLAQFKNTFCEYKRVTKWFGGKKSYVKEFITGYDNIDYLYSLIGHYIYECDLELKVTQRYQTYHYRIDQDARDEYYSTKEFFLKDDVMQWKNNNIFMEMTQKMQHCYAITRDKFNVLDEHFKKYPADKHIIFVKYINSGLACKARYPDAMVLNYQSGSFGLNLQHLPYTIYFDKNWDYALRLQGSRRNYRLGQNFDCYYWDLTGDIGLEELIDKNIAKKVGQAEYFKEISSNDARKELDKVL